MAKDNNFERHSMAAVVGKMLMTGVRMLIGAPLIVSGLVHFSNPYLFLESVLRYELLPSSIAPAFAALIMCVCLCTGLSLVFDWFRQGALAIAMALFTIFAVGQTVVMLRGLTVMCGCFGTFSHQVSWSSVTGLILISVLTFLLFFFDSPRPKVTNHPTGLSDA